MSRLPRHIPDHTRAPAIAPVWWFAVTNVVAAFVLSIGFHTAMSFLTGRWWAHALMAPLFFVMSLAVVHHALSALTNALVQAVFARFSTSPEPATSIQSGFQLERSLRSFYGSVDAGADYPRAPWSVDPQRSTRPASCDEGPYPRSSDRLAMP